MPVDIIANYLTYACIKPKKSTVKLKRSYAVVVCRRQRYENIKKGERRKSVMDDIVFRRDE